MILYSWFMQLYRLVMPRFVRFIQLQIFVTIFSLPILVAWGLPISIMSCVGNLVYSPFLALFLLVSCLIFFFELCFVPNEWFIWLLEWLTTTWSWLISQGSSTWLIGFIKPPLWILLCVPLGAFFIMHHKKLSKSGVSTACLLALLLSAVFFLKYYPTQQLIIKQISCNNGFVTIVKVGNTITVIDPGVVGQRIAGNWIEYTLIKELVQNFGTTTIDHLIIAKPGILAFDYIADLCHLAHVSKLYLPLWQGESDKRLLQKYGRMRYELEDKKGTLIRIGLKKPQTIKLSKKIKIAIEPLEKQLNYKDVTFPLLCIKVINDELDQNVELLN